MNKRIWFRYFCGIFGDARKLKRNIYCWAAVYRCFDCRHKNDNRFWFWLCVSWCVSNGISSSRETCHFIFSISFFCFQQTQTEISHEIDDESYLLLFFSSFFAVFISRSHTHGLSSLYSLLFSLSFFVIYNRNVNVRHGIICLLVFNITRSIDVFVQAYFSCQSNGSDI